MCLALAPFLLPARPALALGGAVVVKSTADTDDANADNCTLREALQGISLARTDPNVHSYHECSGIQQGLNAVTFTVSGTINVNSSLPDITSNVTITGPIIINGAPGVNVPIFRVSSSDAIFNLANLTLTKGEPAILGLNSQAIINIAGVSFVGNVRDGNGGAIDDSGRLNIAGSNFTGNSSDGTDGGGAIHHSGSDPINIGGSVFNGNVAKRSGGAIYTLGPGNIADTIFNGNIAKGLDPNNSGADDAADDYFSQGGGAIYNANDGSNGRKMVITRSVFNGNLAAPKANAGAIFNQIISVVEIRDSAFNGNLAGSLNNDRLGGAIVNAGAELTLAHATFLNNAVTGDGGAIALDRGHTVSISNVTNVANAATNRGGGISSINSQQGSDIRPNLTLRNATLALNVASSGGNYYGQAPTSSYPTPHIFGNTIFSGSDATGGNCAGGAFTSEGHNLDSGTSCGLTATGDLQGANAALEAPSFNGGPIQTLLTMKLGAGSQALDGGDPAICAADPVANEDERGESRGGDGDGNGVGGCDIGAYEGETLRAGFGSTPVKPGPINVGNVVLGGSGSTTFQIYSTGNKPLEVTSPQITGANAADFALGTQFPISTSASVDVTVTCTPGGSTPSIRTAGLSFSTNDPNNPTVGFDLICNATPAPQPGYGSTPAAPGPLDVGDVALGANGASVLLVQETGNATLAVNTPVLGGANPGDFSVGAVDITIPDGGAAVPINVTCAPQSFGVRSATLTLNTNDPIRPQVTYNLICQGVPPVGPVLEVPGQSIPNNLVPGAAGPYGVLVTHDGKHVYSADEGDGLVTVYGRDSNGQLVFQGGELDESNGVTTLAGARMLVEHPNGEVIYVSAMVDDAVTAFRRDLNSGQLTLIDSVRQGDTYGLCAPLPCSPPQLTGMDGAFGMAVSPDGSYLYTSSINDSTIKVFGLNPDGSIKLGVLQFPVQTVTNAALSAGYEITLSPDGAYLYATGYVSDALLVFSRNASTGQLTFVESFNAGQVPTLNGVFRVTISPDGNFLYTASYDSHSLTAFRRDPSTGKLTFLASYTDGAGGIDGLNQASSVKLSPDGRVLFATGHGDDALAVFDRNPLTGLLTFRQAIKRNGSGVPALAGARDVAVAPDGRMVFATGHDDNRVVALAFANPRPALISLAPASAQAGSPSFTLAVNGVNFVQGAVVRWNGADLPTTFVSGGELRASVDASLLGAAGTATVSVRNPAPGGGDSVNTLPFLIRAADQNPVPSIEQLIPAGTLAGGPALLLTVKGSGFIGTSKVYWNGVERPTVFVSATTLQADIGAVDVAQPGAAAVNVVTPGPGGGPSNALPFEIGAPGQNPPPAISQISPASAVVGLTPTSGLTVTIYGAGFIEGSQAQWNGQDRPTSYVSASELHMSVSGADIAQPGPNSVQVINPEPGGGPSNIVSFNVGAAGENPVPSLLRVRVASVNGDGTITLALSGDGFVAGSQGQWNGQDRPTSAPASASEISMTITVADYAAGSGAVTVVNPSPGGGSSEEVLLQLRKLAIPILLN
jgi:CSLREA domain-containing protein